MTLSTPFQRRLLVEEFTRLRRADDIRRYAASQRRGRVDANPHQVDAVAFALERIPEGGCILADEVGLGKTIEAGLIIAQLMAEGLRRVLLIVPKALMGQWQTELYQLFGFTVKIGEMNPEAFTGDGIFVVNREFAGGVRGAPLLSSADPFELAIIDEAHELFSGIYKRFDRAGEYQDDAKMAQTAHRVRNLLKERQTPVLLLTATPMQNNLEELWGLVHYVERTDYLLGNLPTYRQMFSVPSREEDGLPQELAFDLRNRLKSVVQRSLRRQAQAFLEVPFVERFAKTVEYQLSAEERQLYNDVTEWLMRPELLSYTTGTRRLLVVGFHRRMASSFAALRTSLQNVANRLRTELESGGEDGWQGAIEIFAADLEELPEELDSYLEDSEAQPDQSGEQQQPRDPEKIAEELELLESFIQRASELQEDSKSSCLLTTLSVIRDREEQGVGTGKVVIFTESLETQNYLQSYLLKNGYSPQDITLFRGSNDQPGASEALAKWETEVAATLHPSQLPPPDVAVRLALVHEFRTRSRIFIATEAGAKGLNLQFCESLINYDLPWNPQRIEQRIGRVHRYGQKLSVFVFNLIDRGNEAATLTFEILSRKLDLFGKVLDASDDVLHTPEHDFPQSLVSDVGVDFERQVRQVYQQSTSIDDAVAQLRHLRESVDRRRAEFDQTQLRCSELIDSRLDDSVSQIFRNHKTQLPACLAEIDHEMDTIFHSYLDVIDCQYSRSEAQGAIHYQLDAHQALPQEYQQGGQILIGDDNSNKDTDCLYQGHPLLDAAIADAKSDENTAKAIRLICDDSSALAILTGQRGRVRVSKLAYRGLVAVDRLVVTLVTERSLDPFDNITVTDLLALQAVSCPHFESEIDNDLIDECVEESVFNDQHEIGADEQMILDARTAQLERYLQDRILVLNQKKLVISRELAELDRRRDSSGSPAALEKINTAAKKASQDIARLDRQLDELRNGVDSNYQAWRESLFQRRKQAPVVSTVLDVHFEMGKE